MTTRVRSFGLAPCLVFAGLLACPRAEAMDFDPGYLLAKVADKLEDIKQDFRNGIDGIDTKQCTEALAKMRSGQEAKGNYKVLLKYGATKIDELKVRMELDQAVKLCNEASRMATALVDYKLFESIGRNMHLLEDPSFGANIAKLAVQDAAKCEKAVDAMLGAKIPASFPYVVYDRDAKPLTKTVADVKPKVCEASRKLALKYTKALEDAEKEYDNRLKKAGLSGDKLYWMKHYDGNVFLAGGKTPDLPAYAKATVWFAYIYSSDADADGNHLFTVRRYEFKGDKLAKQTEQTYKKPLDFKLSIGSVMR